MKKIINFKEILNIKKIVSLTKVLCKEYYQNLPIFRKKDSSQGKIFKICSIIAIVALAFLTFKIVEFLGKTTHPEIFLNIYLLLLGMIIIFQQIIASTNVYYFSKDLEFILPFPIKPVELLIGRFNMLVSISYISMAIFGIIPLLIYGLMASNSLLYFPGMVLVLVSFPIFSALIVSIIMMFIIQLSKIIKNKEVFQFAVTIILMVILAIFENQAINTIFSNADKIQQIQQGENIDLIEIINEKIIDINNYLVTVNPSAKILTENNFFIIIFEFLKIVIFNLNAFLIFIFVGKRLYLKNLLRNIQQINTSKLKRKKAKFKYKKTNKNKSYIRNEFKELIKTPAFFMQCVFPVIMILITVIVIAVALKPSILEIMKDEEIAGHIEKLEIDISVLTTIAVITQILYTFSNLSITAISRKGKNAFFIKQIPISLYKQFLYLNIPQILLNTIISIIVLILAKYFVPEIQLLHIIILFIIGLILNIINSFLMLVADLRKPNLEWDNETDAIKQNQNKLFQYVLTIIIILILVYLSSIFETINLNLAIIIILFILIFILFLINKIIKNKINKLFNKIN